MYNVYIYIMYIYIYINNIGHFLGPKLFDTFGSGGSPHHALESWWRRSWFHWLGPQRPQPARQALLDAGNGDANVWLKMEKTKVKSKKKDDQSEKWSTMMANLKKRDLSYYILLHPFQTSGTESPSSGSRINITIPAVLSSSSSPSATMPKKLKASSICGRRQQLKISSGTSKRAAKSKTSGSPRRWNNSRKFQLPM